MTYWFLTLCWYPDLNVCIVKIFKFEKFFKRIRDIWFNQTIVMSGKHHNVKLQYVCVKYFFIGLDLVYVYSKSHNVVVKNTPLILCY